ncbi:MAG: 5'-deoxynucleotidase [Lachnospiraceae bacterium]|nr:5'-deoxynucleotidase [Lachnospiraceae bacterium]
MDSEYTFLALMHRMNYIERWALMRNARTENVGEHSLEVCMILHLLCEIGNSRFGRHLDPGRAVLLALYHDAPEILTGDMPTPVKYYNDRIRESYRDIEEAAKDRLLGTLPGDLKEKYEKVLTPAEDEKLLAGLLKAADKLSALIKCMEEESAGNGEFRTALETTRKTVLDLAGEYPEVKVFMDEFLPAYGRTLDELTNKVSEEE